MTPDVNLDRRFPAAALRIAEDTAAVGTAVRYILPAWVRSIAVQGPASVVYVARVAQVGDDLSAGPALRIPSGGLFGFDVDARELEVWIQTDVGARILIHLSPLYANGTPPAALAARLERTSGACCASCEVG